MIGFVMLTAVAAQIRVPLPFTPVPFTLQVLAVLLSGYVLGALGGAVSMSAYLGLGALGLPAFSGGAGGWGALTGFTGGYLLASPLAAFVVGLLAGRSAAPLQRVFAGFFGLAIIHLGGIGWLLWMGNSVPRSPLALLTWSTLPFLGPDLVKVLIAERLSRPSGLPRGPVRRRPGSAPE
ncbi:MAG: biotin transporter BioY [Acidobacteriota bacterium]